MNIEFLVKIISTLFNFSLPCLIGLPYHTNRDKRNEKSNYVGRNNLELKYILTSLATTTLTYKFIFFRKVKLWVEVKILNPKNEKKKFEFNTVNQSQKKINKKCCITHFSTFQATED